MSLMYCDTAEEVEPLEDSHYPSIAAPKSCNALQVIPKISKNLSMYMSMKCVAYAKVTLTMVQVEEESWSPTVTISEAGPHALQHCFCQIASVKNQLDRIFVMGLGPGDAGRTDRDLSQWNYHTRLMYRNQLCLTTHLRYHNEI
jgi:hypothetical protein